MTSYSTYPFNEQWLHANQCYRVALPKRLKELQRRSSWTTASAGRGTVCGVSLCFQCSCAYSQTSVPAQRSRMSGEARVLYYWQTLAGYGKTHVMAQRGRRSVSVRRKVWRRCLLAGDLDLVSPRSCGVSKFVHGPRTPLLASATHHQNSASLSAPGGSPRLRLHWKALAALSQSYDGLGASKTHMSRKQPDHKQSRPASLR